MAGATGLTRLSRRGALAGLIVAPLAGPALASAPTLKLTGRFQQGGFAFGRTFPRAQLFVDGAPEGQASLNGLFVVGFDRDAAAEVELRIVTDDGETVHKVPVAAGDFRIQRIDGLPADQVSPTDEALLARIGAESERKAAGFASLADLDEFRTGFIAPLKSYRQTARFGGQRILNGEPKRPHYGADLAAPTGTPIRAPAGGVVAFAETGLHFEGGLTLIDHGQGLITAYLHQSRIDVVAGQPVAQGQTIGAVGKEGRATGPHLCWRMKWRGRNLDPTLMLGARAPA